MSPAVALLRGPLLPVPPSLRVPLQPALRLSFFAHAVMNIEARSTATAIVVVFIVSLSIM